MGALEVRRDPDRSRQGPGECRLRRGVGGRIIIERADPHVWLEDEFLRRLVGPEGNRNKWVNLTYQPLDLCEPALCCQRFRGGHCYFGGVLSIQGDNATVIYRVGSYVRGGFWEARFA